MMEFQVAPEQLAQDVRHARRVGVVRPRAAARADSPRAGRGPGGTRCRTGRSARPGLSWPWVVNIRTLAGRLGREHAGRRAAAGRSTCPVLRVCRSIPSPRRHSSRQSPAVMSPTRPPLAAMMVAIRRSDRSRVSGLTCSVSHSLPEPGEARPGRGSGPSRRSAAAARSWPAASPRRAGSRHRRSAAAARRPGRDPAVAGREPVRRGEPADRAGSRQPLPASSAPEAIQRSCQVSPGWLPASPAPASGPATAAAARSGLSSANGGASSSADACSRSSAVAGQPARAGPRRELPHHLRALRCGRAGADAREQHRRRQPGRGAAGHEASPNRTFSVSGR